MDRIPQVATALQTVLGTETERLARETGFVQRESKLTGSKFVQALTFGWLGNPDCTLEGLAQTATSLGVPITPQGIAARFSKCAAEYLKHILQMAIGTLLETDGVSIPLLQRFQGVLVTDSTVIALPDALWEVWVGCGNGRTGSRAALKLQVRLDLNKGALPGLGLENGRAQDRSTPLQQTELPTGSLSLSDLGYFSLDVLKAQEAQGVYWLSRLQVNVVIYDAEGRRCDLLTLLQKQGLPSVDIPVTLGQQQRLSCRLLAVHEPPEKGAERRRHLHAEAAHKGQSVSQARLRLAEWSIYITNVPVDKLSLAEALVLVKARWQIELLFKLWKSHGHIDESRSTQPWRILCEVYAKLLGMLIQHWIFMVSCWQNPNRSLTKAAQTVARQAGYLAATFSDPERLEEALRNLANCLLIGCRMNSRKAKPNTYQQLLAPTAGALA
jgi:hypothetical protein